MNKLINLLFAGNFEWLIYSDGLQKNRKYRKQKY